MHINRLNLFLLFLNIFYKFGALDGDGEQNSCIQNTDDYQMGFVVKSLNSTNDNGNTSSSSYTYISITHTESKITVTNLAVYGNLAGQNIPAVVVPPSIINETFPHWKHGIFFSFCPGNLKENVFLVDKTNNYNNKLKGEKFNPKSTRCSLAFCQIGLYFYDKDIGSTKDLDHYEYPFYVGFKGDSIKSSLYFKVSSYAKNNFYLYPCPYYGWINEISIAKFIPSPNIVGNGLVIDEKDRRHIYVPVLPLSENHDYFTCGEIIQLGNLGSISVGYKLKEEKEESKELSSLLFNEGGSITCEAYTINPVYTWRYGPLGMNNNSNFQSMEYMGQKLQLYSGHYLFYYDFQKIHESYTIGRNNGRIKDENLESALDYHKPSCVGKIGDVPAKIKLKNNNFLSLSPKKVDQFDVYHLSDNAKTKKIDVTCELKLDVDSKYMNDDFYNLRYKPILVKGSISNNLGKSKNINNFDFSSDSLEGYGFYSCILDDSMTNKLIKPSQFLILPEIEIIMKEDKTRTYETLPIDFSCKKVISEDIEQISLSQIIVIYNGLTKIYNKGEKKDHFEDKSKDVVFKLGNKTDKLIMKCIYKISQIDFATIEKTYQMMSNFTQNDTKTYSEDKVKEYVSDISKSISKPNDDTAIIIIVSLLILFLLFVIIFVIIVVNKKKKKRKDKPNRTNLISSIERSLNNSKSPSQSISNPSKNLDALNNKKRRVRLKITALPTESTMKKNISHF
uniref:EGF-like domain-containing protein n=1 Tax=Strongyloides papillosus TaxID=174720 RepID=A0A0N5BMA9_STREA